MYCHNFYVAVNHENLDILKGKGWDSTQYREDAYVVKASKCMLNI